MCKEHDVQERVFLVTGATSGIGLATASELARTGARVIAVGGRRTSVDKAEAAIRARAPEARLAMFSVELSDLDDVRRLAAEVLTRYDRLDVLLNVAGRALTGPDLSRDGVDPLFAANHLGPFLLTNLLLDRVRESGSGRVITVTSSRHRGIREVPWAYLEDRAGRPPADIYAVTKLLNVLFTAELARRVCGDGVVAIAADPGFVRTGLGRDATGLFRVFLRVAAPFQTAPEAAARHLVYLALAEEAKALNGRYLDQGKTVEPSPLAQDATAAARLWDLSAALTAGH